MSGGISNWIWTSAEKEILSPGSRHPKLVLALGRYTIGTESTLNGPELVVQWGEVCVWLFTAEGGFLNILFTFYFLLFSSCLTSVQIEKSFNSTFQHIEGLFIHHNAIVQVAFIHLGRDRKSGVFVLGRNTPKDFRDYHSTRLLSFGSKSK